MSLDFLHEHGGRRLRPYLEQPLLAFPPGEDESEDDAPAAQLDVEQAPDRWQPISLAGPLDDEVVPRRFIDGCHLGETVAWLRDLVGHPIPVRLAEVGGVCMRVDGRALRREFAHIERVVSLIVDPFPWHEVESFARALGQIGLRLLPAALPFIEEERRGLTYDFERMREQTRTRSQYEMEVLEELALWQDPLTPSLVDGRLGRFWQMDLGSLPLVGVIKQQRESYLHPEGWQVLYDLEPGQRTPAFKLPSKHVPVLSWYLKLDGSQGALPNWGIIRVEIPWDYYEGQALDFDYVDRLSYALLNLRCRQGSYARAAVSLEPIVRAEESLKALLTAPATLAQRFYRLTGL